MVNELHQNIRMNCSEQSSLFLEWVEQYLASVKRESDIVPSNFIKVYLRVK
jgi:hypothetical protein